MTQPNNVHNFIRHLIQRATGLDASIARQLAISKQDNIEGLFSLKRDEKEIQINISKHVEDESALKREYGKSLMDELIIKPLVDISSEIHYYTSRDHIKVVDERKWFTRRNYLAYPVGTTAGTFALLFRWSRQGIDGLLVSLGLPFAAPIILAGTVSTGLIFALVHNYIKNQKWKKDDENNIRELAKKSFQANSAKLYEMILKFQKNGRLSDDKN